MNLLASAPQAGAFFLDAMIDENDRNDEAARLQRARVLVIGLGALGCPAALHLAAAGVGTLILLDPDRVELSNLPRQILHRTSTLGMFKVDSAAARLRVRFPSVRCEPHAEALTPENLAGYFGDADFAIDATDGAAAKFLINDGAVRVRRPFSHAGIIGFLGQTMTVLPGRSACYRCLFPEPPEPGEIPSCQEAGVMAGVGGIVGALQAAEAIACVSGDGVRLAGRLLTVDALSGRWRTIEVPRNRRCPVCVEASPDLQAERAAAKDARLAVPAGARYGERNV
jgi:molybdopterin/thiamine biosynthesis adenylyltransferase